MKGKHQVVLFDDNDSILNQIKTPMPEVPQTVIDNFLKSVDESMTLQERAQAELDQDNSNLTRQQKVRNAGWHNGEWTCACCGVMIGKNLKGELPFLLSDQHTKECDKI